MRNRGNSGPAPSQDLLNGPASLWLTIAWATAIYWPVTFVLATRKQFWNDELFTYYIGALNTFPRIWSALLTAVDQNPPLFYWFTHRVTEATGQNLIGLRLPAMLGFWLAAVCMIAFVSRHLPTVYGLLAALILLVSRAYWYAYEARPYGLVLGLAAVALLCWQRADGPRTLWRPVGLALALGLAVSMHYYSVLLFVPLATAEACRSWVNKRLNWPVWLAFAAAASCLLLYLPLIRSARSYSGTFWAKPRLDSLIGFVIFFVNPALLALIGAALLWVVFANKKTVRTLAEAPGRWGFPAYELVAALGMLFIVPLAIAIGKLVTGAYTHRYAVSGVLGLSFLLVWMLASAFQARSAPANVLAVLFSCAFLIRMVPGVGETNGISGYDHSGVIRVLEQGVPNDLPIAVADPLLFFELFHQSPPKIRSRLFYVAEPKIAIRRVGTDTMERTFIDVRTIASLQVKTLASVINSREKFLIIGYPAASLAWLVEELTSLHVPMSVAGSLGQGIILLAEPGHKEPKSEASAGEGLK
jgi:hypothetical protein